MDRHSTVPIPRQILTPPQLLSYLKHINYPSSHSPRFALSSLPPPSYELLCQLMWLHLGAVPWENLTMHYGDGEVDLGVGKMWGKVVGRGREVGVGGYKGKDGEGEGDGDGGEEDVLVRRARERGGWGGYCMQTNGLFMAALRAVGFTDVWGTGARISKTTVTSGADRSGTFDGWSHMCLLVPIDGQTYFCDVGFGANNPVVPLPLIPDIVTPGLAPHSYRLLHKPIRECRNQNLKYWVLQIQNTFGGEKEDGEGVDGEWLDAYMFSPETEFLEDDYNVLSWTVSHRDGSLFTDVVLCVKATLETELVDGEEVVKGVNGRLIMIGNSVKQRVNGKVKLLERFETEEDRVRALEKYFGIVLREEERRGIFGRKTEIVGVEKE
ncbi:hypothetical protein DFH27DRAFT_638588 [Peziza echinospora]|nr:hypothetical protein DFH27DRAFT_638588 [Peziza echinospora]